MTFASILFGLYKNCPNNNFKKQILKRTMFCFETRQYEDTSTTLFSIVPCHQLLDKPLFTEGANADTADKCGGNGL